MEPLYYAVPEYMLDHLTKQSISHIKQFHALPAILNPSVAPITKDKQAKFLNLTSFDTSLPQDWVDDVIKLTGENPVPHVVWHYTDHTFGQAKAITMTGEVILRIYWHIKDKSR